MDAAAFPLILAAGAVPLAAWMLDRFPEWMPRSLGRTLVHLGISLGLVWAAPNAVGPLAAWGVMPALSAVFLLVLPALIYAFLASAWILRLVHEAITH